MNCSIRLELYANDLTVQKLDQSTLLQSDSKCLKDLLVSSILPSKNDFTLYTHVWTSGQLVFEDFVVDCVIDSPNQQAQIRIEF